MSEGRPGANRKQAKLQAGHALKEDALRFANGRAPKVVAT